MDWFLALLTAAVTAAAFVRGEPAPVRWSLAASLLATLIAFLGTARALPALLGLQRVPEDEAALSKILDRFAGWHAFSAVWQLIAFAALLVVLAAGW
jgi:hypothetical protein